MGFKKSSHSLDLFPNTLYRKYIKEIPPKKGGRPTQPPSYTPVVVHLQLVIVSHDPVDLPG